MATRVVAAMPDSGPVPLDGSWKRVLDRPNALRLNRWLAHTVREADDEPAEFATPRLDDSGWVAVEAVPLRYRDTERDVWIDQLALPSHPASVWYRRHLEIDGGVARDAVLRIEDGAIEGAWTLFVNGSAVEPATGGAEVGPAGFLADVLLLPIGDLLTAGDNLLALRIAAGPKSPAGRTPELRTPLHLLGSFDVVGPSGARRLHQPLPASRFGDRAGIPHFAGRIAYRRQRQPGGVPLSLPDTTGDPVGVSFAGRDLGVRCWPPYRWELRSTDAAGGTDLMVELTTTMLPFYEGQQWIDGRAVDR